MNYTGRPSISGCRPVLSLYPTHRFCQYLLLIFITFTNSSLFNRAFSTNSRRPLRRAAGVTAPGCALSGASRQLSQRGRSSTSPSLLRNATSPTEGRLWQSPQSERFRQRLPYQGSCLRSRLRGCTKTEPFPCRKVRLVASLPVSFCRSLWYTYFAPGARALTPLLYL